MLCFGLTIGGISGVASAGTPLPGATNCDVFPPDNVLNTPVANLPVNPLSASVAGCHGRIHHQHPARSWSEFRHAHHGGAGVAATRQHHVHRQRQQ